MNLSKNSRHNFFFLAALMSLLGLFAFSKTIFAFGDRSMGGRVAVISPSLAVTEDKSICKALNETVGEVTVTSTWSGNTDNGSDKTFTLIPNLTPKPSPNTFIVEDSVLSKTGYSLEEDRLMLGLYQTEYKSLGSCSVTTTVTYPYYTVTVDIPFYAYVGKVTLYGASAGL
jgi:hypothetical protein